MYSLSEMSLIHVVAEDAHKLEVLAVAAALPSCPAVVPPVTLVVGMLATLKGELESLRRVVHSLCPSQSENHEQNCPDDY